jgi:hypothetical protein
LFTSPGKPLEGFAIRHYLIATGIHFQSIWISGGIGRPLLRRLQFLIFE